jgi:hypothetical protein
MSRTAKATFAAVALFLCLFPLFLAKPGLPLSLKSDEPAYYLMALSLAKDFDLRCETKDVARLAVEFPHSETRNLILGSLDHWRTVYFAKPYLVSLFAAPFAALFGANGFVAMNMALLLGSVWLGALWLKRENDEAPALLFSFGFFFLSNIFSYVFWLHTEILCVASVTACLYFGLTDGVPVAGAGRLARPRAWVASASGRLALSGAVLVVGAYNKPYLALLGLPVIVRAFRRGGARAAASWIAGAAASALVVCGLSILLIGRPTPYLGFPRFGVEVTSFDRMPRLPTPEEAEAAAAEAAGVGLDDAKPALNSFVWILTSARVDAGTLANLGYFLIGRHTGLFPYAPFVLLALLLFLFRRPREPERWLLLASLAAIGLWSIVYIWFNWHGGGGFVGNRYFVNALPGFLFLAGRIAPSWLPALGYALAGLFVGGLVFTPFGAHVPSPTLQAHTRNGAFQLLPLERTFERSIPGYLNLRAGGGAFLFGRADQFFPVDDSLLVVGGRPVEIELRTPAPVARPVFEVATFVAPNRVELELGGARARIDFDDAAPPKNVTRVTLERPRPAFRLLPSYETSTAYRLVVSAERQVWRDQELAYRAPSTEAAVKPPLWWKGEERVLVGAAVSYLGERDELDADLYAVDWLDTPLPDAWPAGRLVSLPIRIRNASGAVWRQDGAIAVAVSYHWLRPDGSRESWEGVRSQLPKDVGPGEAVTVLLQVETPGAPGSYVLELDLVRERIAWFSERRDGQSLTRPIEIVPAEGR